MSRRRRMNEPTITHLTLSEVASFCSANKFGRARVKETTTQMYQKCINRIVDFLGHETINVADISTDDMLDWQDWLDARAEINVVSANTYKRTARAMWYNMRQRGVAVCDVAGVFKFHKEPKGVKGISEKNAHKMLVYSGIRETAIILLANQSGRRRGGLADMRVSKTKVWVDEEGEYCVAAGVVEKGEKPQLLFAYHEAGMALSLWLKIRADYLADLGIPDHDYVFINLQDGSPLSAAALTANNNRIKQKAGIPADEPCNLHAHRHYRAKKLRDVLGLDVVAALLGHEDISTTAIYTTPSADELQDFFFRAIKGKGVK